MKKYYFKKETIGSEKFLIAFTLATILIIAVTMMAQNKYAAAIDPQIISEAMQNQKKSDGEYYSTVY